MDGTCGTIGEAIAEMQEPTKPNLDMFRDKECPIISAMESNIKGQDILRFNPPLTKYQQFFDVGDKLTSRYLDLIKSEEYAQAAADPRYTKRLGELKDQGDEHLLAYNRFIVGAIDAHINFFR